MTVPLNAELSSNPGTLCLNLHRANLLSWHACWVLPVCLFAPSLVVAATNTDTSPLWNSILTLVVIAVTAGSTALPISAYRYWTGYWKLVAAIPLLALVAWSSWIVIARLLQPTTHQYWLLEIFAWAMLAMLYMATMMTAKRQFEKAENSGSSAK